MTSNTDSGQQPSLVDLDEGALIADSQLDYPGREGGWQYVAIDTMGELSPLVRRSDVGAEFTTHESYRVGSADHYCKLGRDFIHPGYEQFPALAWEAIGSRRVILCGEIACVNALSVNPARVIVSISSKPIWSATYRFPEILRFRLHLHVVKDDLLTFQVRAERYIDQQFGCYYCWLVDDGAAEDERRDPSIASRSETVLDDAWRDFGSKIASVAELPAKSAMQLAYGGFDAVFELPKWPERWTSARSTGREEPREFGNPRFFSATPRSPS